MGKQNNASDKWPINDSRQLVGKFEQENPNTIESIIGFWQIGFT